MNNALEELNNFDDLNDLRLALQSLCARFGTIGQLDILEASQRGKRQALCFLRLQTRQQEQHFMSELGIGRFGGDLVLIVDLRSPKPTVAILAQAPLPPDLTPKSEGYTVDSHNKPFNA